MTLTFPSLTVGPSGFGMSILGKTQTLISPLTKKGQSKDDGGYKWLCEVDYAVLSENDWRILQAFFAQIEGITQKFYYTPPHVATPQGAGGGTPIVDGIGQTGLTLTTVGWPPHTNVLAAGDCFSFDTSVGTREMKMVTVPVTSDASGVATINFEPRIRISPPNSSSIIINSPSFIGRLLSLNMSTLAFQPGNLASCHFQVVEAIV